MTNSLLDDNIVFDLSAYLFQHNLDLMRHDIMYQSMNESFDVSSLLYPLHRGKVAYISRDNSSFIERNSELLALGVTLFTIFYGAFQTIKSRIERKEKVRIDRYFLEFLDIRSKTVSVKGK